MKILLISISGTSQRCWQWEHQWISTVFNLVVKTSFSQMSAGRSLGEKYFILYSTLVTIQHIHNNVCWLLSQCLCVFMYQLSDLMADQLELVSPRGGGGSGVSHEALVDGCRWGGLHQGLNLFSQFCFPKRFPTEVFLSRWDLDCRVLHATVKPSAQKTKYLGSYFFRCL